MSAIELHVPIAIVERALAEAYRRGEHYLDSEHLLIAVATATPLRARGLDTEWLRSAVERVLGLGTPLPGPSLRGAAMPSSNASNALQRAGRIAEAAGRTSATEEDLLLALLEAPPGQHMAAAVLSAAGMSVEAICAELRTHKTR